MFSRRSGSEVGTTYRWNVMWPAFRAQANFSNAVLDGEVIVWNKTAGDFAPMPHIRPVVTAAVEHAPAGQPIVEYHWSDDDKRGARARLLAAAATSSCHQTL
jgi:hypothetical protein